MNYYWPIEVYFRVARPASVGWLLYHPTIGPVLTKGATPRLSKKRRKAKQRSRS